MAYSLHNSDFDFAQSLRFVSLVELITRKMFFDSLRRVIGPQCYGLFFRVYDWKLFVGLHYILSFYITMKNFKVDTRVKPVN